jgi:L-rhamnose-H+ transport protein
MNPFFGVFLDSLAGLSAASFYVPINKVKRWAWETYWITLGFFAWIVSPILVASIVTPDLWGILGRSPGRTLLLTYLFGAGWGVGGLTCGLGLRYLGLSLGQSISLGFCVAFGTLIPPIFEHKASLLFATSSGQIVLLSVFICLVGIAICGYAGILKERQLTDEQKKESIKDFSLAKGYLVAIIGGVMSASMAFAIGSGEPIARIAEGAGTASIYRKIAVMVPALAGGFTTNFVACLILNLKNKSIRDYATGPGKTLLANYLLAALSGAMWYGQFFFYCMGETKMGRYSFAGWSIFLAFIIVFSNLWGVYLREWKLVNRRTWNTLWVGIAILIVSAAVNGLGNHLSAR